MGKTLFEERPLDPKNFFLSVRPIRKPDSAWSHETTWIPKMDFLLAESSIKKSLRLQQNLF